MAAIYVSPATGNDANGGTSASAPVRSLTRAQALWQALPTTLDEDIDVWLFGDTFETEAPLSMSVLDDAAPDRFLRFRPYGSTRPKFKASVPLQGWTIRNDGLWSVMLPSGAAPPAFLRYGLTTMRPAFFKSATDQRVVSWDEVNFTVTIPRASFDALAVGDTPYVRLPMGWCVTIAKVASWAFSGPNVVLTLDPGASVLEFAKGTPSASHAGLARVSDMFFGLGPFHVVGSRVFTYGSVNFVSEPGDMNYNFVTRELVVYPLPGVTLDQFEAAVRRPTGITTAFDNDGASRVMFYDLDFTEFGWSAFAENYVGYDQGLRIAVQAGDPAAPPITYRFEENPAVLRSVNGPDFKVVQCRFKLIGHSCVRLAEGSHRPVVRACEGREIDAQGVDVNVYDLAPEIMTDAQKIREVDIWDNDWQKIGGLYTGTAISVGTVIYGRIFNNTIREVSSGGISTGRGSRINNIAPDNYPQLHMRAHRNFVFGACREQTDEAGLYNSGVWHFIAPGIATPDPLPEPTLRVCYNHFEDIRNTGFDPNGGRSAAVYLDLPAYASDIQFNTVFDVDYPMKSNCVRGNLWANNRITGRTIQIVSTYWSGYNLFFWDPRTFENPIRQYIAPVATTGDYFGQTNQAWWDGSFSDPAWTAGETVTKGTIRRNGDIRYSADTAGTTGSIAPTHRLNKASDGGVTWLAFQFPFKEELPFATLPEMFLNGTDVGPGANGYAPASTYTNNGDITIPYVYKGASASVLSYLRSLPPL